MAKLSREEIIDNHRRLYKANLKYVKELEKQMKKIVENEEIIIVSPANGDIVNPQLKSYTDAVQKFNTLASTLYKMIEVHEGKANTETDTTKVDPFNFQVNK